MFETPLGNLFIPLLLLSGLIIAVALLVAHRATFVAKYISPFQLFFLFFIGYNVIGWPLVLNGSSRLGPVNFELPVYLTFYFYLHGCLLALAFGAAHANFLLGMPKERIAKDWVRGMGGGRASLVMFGFCLLIVGLGAWRNYDSLGALFSADEYSETRQEIAREGNYFSYVLSKVVVPLGALYAFGYALERLPLFRRPAAAAILLLGAVGAISTFQKAPVVLLLAAAGVYFIRQRARPLSVRRYILLAVVSLSLAMLISYRGAPGIDLGTLLWAYVDRLMLVGNYLNHAAFSHAYFAGEYFLGGTSFPTLFEGTRFYNYLGREIWIELFPELHWAGKVGTANTCFITALYADFGFLGGIAGSFLLGTLLQAVSLTLQPAGGSIWSKVLFVLLTVFSVKFNYTHLGTALLSEGWGLLLFLLLAVRFSDWAIGRAGEETSAPGAECAPNEEGVELSSLASSASGGRQWV